MDWDTLLTEARERFGIDSLRPGQKELVDAVLEGRDALGVLPTGAGKSLCFQLPAPFIPGLTLIVSPLLALMQDQEEKLTEIELEVTRLDSSISSKEMEEAHRDIRRGNTEFVYVTPEQLEKPERVEALKRSGVSLFVVDEAHCISQWGHDFRPAYLSLGEVVQKLGRPPILALTATATPQVRQDILTQLGMREPLVVSTGVFRPNLFLEVARTVNAQAKHEALLELVRTQPGTGIVYVATVRVAQELYRWLEKQGVRVGLYHGKRRHKDREQVQQRFMNDDYSLIVATKAFGMGIDKANIRYVVHYHFPDSLESYYQEAGRAGRDGDQARCVLLFRLEDRRIQGFFLGGKYPKREESQRVYETLKRLGAEEAKPIAMGRLVQETALPQKRLKVLVAQLVAAGIVARTRGGLRMLRDFADAEALDAYLSAYEERHHSDRERLETMMRYGSNARCRWRFLADYFAEPLEEDCGHCDNCRGEHPPIHSSAEEKRIAM